MFRVFKNPETPPTTAAATADGTLAGVTAAEYAARGVQTGVTTATAVGVTALAASGPALPVVAGIALLAAAASRIYFLNKKLTSLFKRAERLTSRMIPVLDVIESRKLGLKTADVRDAATQIQTTIGELLGPNALKEINEVRGSAAIETTRSSWMARLKRYGRMVAPAATLTLFNEQLLYLGLEFSVLQGEFAVALDKLPTEEAAAVAAQAGKSGDPSKAPASTTAAELAAANQPAAAATATEVGGRRTRRRRRVKRTRRTADAYLASKVKSST